jgi:hypothetical protein
MKSIFAAIARVFALTAVICVAALAWMTVMPGHPEPSALRPASPGLIDALKTHINAIVGERNAHAQGAALDRTAAYIESQLTRMGHTVQSQWFEVDGIRVRNLAVVIPGSAKGPVVVVGAHYDTARFTPGADDNASGVAALIEIARAAKSTQPAQAELHLVFFTNEEPPWFRTQSMGSFQYAAALASAIPPSKRCCRWKCWATIAARPVARSIRGRRRSRFRIAANSSRSWVI